MSSKARPVKYLSEWQRIYSDPWLLSLVSWLPPLCFLIVYLIFSQGLARELPIGIVDLDQSSLSRNMTRNYDASPTLLVTNIFLSPREGISALRGGGIYGLVLFLKIWKRRQYWVKLPKWMHFSTISSF